MEATGFPKDFQRFSMIPKQLAGLCFFCHALWRVLEGQKSMFSNGFDRFLGNHKFFGSVVFFLPVDSFVFPTIFNDFEAGNGVCVFFDICNELTGIVSSFDVIWQAPLSYNLGFHF